MTKHLKRKTKLTAILLLTGLVLWDNARLVVSRYTLTTDKTNSGFRIVQISDLHNDRHKTDQVYEKTAKERPDIIVVTGDLIDSVDTDVDLAVGLVRELVEIAPVYYVTGNHEASCPEYDELESRMKELGVSVLRNDHVSVSDEIELYGIDDPNFSWNADKTAGEIIRNKLPALASGIDKTKYNILLSHRPDAFRYGKDFDLILSGHMHGGQFRLPFVGGLLSPERKFFPGYDAGKFSKRSTTMIVSRGIGNSAIPVRLNNPSEIIVIDLIPEKKHVVTKQ